MKAENRNSRVVSWPGFLGVGEVLGAFEVGGVSGVILLLDKILHYFKDPKLWELWYSPYNG